MTGIHMWSPCRQLARRAQHRIANRRHQQPEEGRLDHRDRQRDYRRRKAGASSQSATTKSVTDHTPSPTASCVTLLAAASVLAPERSSTIPPPLQPQEWLFYSDRFLNCFSPHTFSSKFRNSSKFRIRGDSKRVFSRSCEWTGFCTLKSGFGLRD
jgi:hypothetical protein